MVEDPDEVIEHRPQMCKQCGEDLSPLAGTVVERRQVLDLPEIRLRVQQHQIEAIRCPHCQETTLGSFPAEVKAPVQYGPTLQAVAVYLHQGQLLPTSRTCETLTALCGCHLSEATVIQWGELAAERLGPTMERLADLLVASPLQHGDETGIRIYGMLHWVHVNCTRFLTHLAWHEARGKMDMQEIGIWSRFSGRGMHDRLVSYDAYGSAHSLCGAHLLRDCIAVAEQEHQPWAMEMHDFLLDLHEACQQWRQCQQMTLPSLERDEWVARSFEILAAGYAAQPPSCRENREKGQTQAKQGQELVRCSAQTR